MFSKIVRLKEIHIIIKTKCVIDADPIEKYSINERTSSNLENKIPFHRLIIFAICIPGGWIVKLLVTQFICTRNNFFNITEKEL